MLQYEPIKEFAREVFGPKEVQTVDVQPLTGGLEAPGVSLVRALRAAGDEAGRFVVKPMSGDAVREYNVHCALEKAECGAAAPRLLGSRADEDGTLYAFLEWIPAAQSWPWGRSDHSARVVQQLARVHSCDAEPFLTVVNDWDYDAALRDSALETVDLYEALFNSGFRVDARPMLRPLERVCGVVTTMRRQAASVTGMSLLHGDVHPGNVVLRKADGASEAVLIDWGRARLGSPLEDVMSWLHSLGFWEPSARTVHDSLLTEYRRARGLQDGLTPAFRSACWMSGACNAMAGALRYHLAVAADPGCDGGERWNSARAAGDWLRIVRRADAVWRS
jgi:aminoglycoside phosphotransferase (APT) family kinase protein